MGTWFSKVISALGGEAEDRTRVLHLLTQAQRTRAKALLEVVAAGQTAVLATIIEQVREDDLIISQPTIGGLTHPLAFGETMTISVALNGTMHTGETQCLGRVRIPAGAGTSGAAPSADAMLYAYRLTLPEKMAAKDRRGENRFVLRFSGEVEAQLYAHAVMDGPIIGRIENLSMSGASIVTNLPPNRLERGRMLYLKSKLPEPGGLIDDLVTIARVETDSATGQTIIGVQFHRRLESVEALMRGAKTAAAA